MRKYKNLIGVTTAVLFAGLWGNANATLLNSGFEDGNLGGWTAVVPAGASAGATTGSFTQTAQSGTYFADLKTNGPGSLTLLSQATYLLASGTISGWASAWDAEEAGGQSSIFDDTVTVSLLDAAMAVVGAPIVILSHAANAGSGISLIPWTAFNFVAPVGGIYSIQLSVTNSLDSIFDSRGFLDSVVSSVPEPGTLALFGIGLFGIIGARRKRSLKA